jgi:hypothetical protein
VNEEWTLLTDSPIVGDDANTDALAAKNYEYFYAGEVQDWFALIDVSASEVLTKHGPFRLNEMYGSETVPMEPYDWSKVSKPADVSARQNQQTQAASQLQQKLDQLKNQDSEPEVFQSLDSTEGSDE